VLRGWIGAYLALDPIDIGIQQIEAVYIVLATECLKHPAIRDTCPSTTRGTAPDAVRDISMVEELLCEEASGDGCESILIFLSIG
jgi:hypothetical protein